MRTLAVLIVWMGAISLSAAEPALRERIKDEHAEGAEQWIYNDLSGAMKEARRSNKPIFVTFRCVPCHACAGFDAEVAKGSKVIEKMAREQFVSVRQVEMKGVDLNQFQFDHDLNWAAMFINADGVVYARYGTQSAEGPDAYNSIEGLANTMRRVLELHKAYPGNAEQLRDKRGPQKPYRTAIEMPGLENKEKYLGLTKRDNCIHCHNIHDAEHKQARMEGKFTSDLLWKYPLPENIGLVIDANDGRRIESVKANSPAAAVGLMAGDEVLTVNGQPITSIADIQWVLHHLPNTDAKVEIGSRDGSKTLALAAGWKKTDFSWRGSMWSVPPELNVWMPPLDPAKRGEFKVPDDLHALHVRWINRGKDGGKAAYESGLREGDLVIAVAGKPIPKDVTPQRFMMNMKLTYKIGQELPLTVLRNGQEKEIRVKLVE